MVDCWAFVVGCWVVAAFWALMWLREHRRRKELEDVIRRHIDPRNKKGEARWT